MSTLLVSPRTKKELKELEEILRKKGIRSRTLRADQFEDLGMSILMEEEDRTKKVTRESVMKKLRK